MVAWLSGFSVLVAGQCAAGSRLEPPGPTRRHSWMISIGSFSIAIITLFLTAGLSLDSGWIGLGYFAALAGRGWQIFRASGLGES